MWFFGLFALILPVVAASVLPENYDVIWNSPGVNHSADSMPLGGGDVGLNVWYEQGKFPIGYISMSPSLTLLMLEWNTWWSDIPFHHPFANLNRKHPLLRRQERCV